MALKVKCKCGKALKIPATLAGKKIACPGCDKRFIIPASRFESAGKGNTSSSGVVTPKSAVATAAKEKVSVAAGASPSELDISPSSLDLEIGLSGSGVLDNLGQSEAAASTFELADAPTVEHMERLPEVETGPRPVCPQCKKTLPAKAKICVECGIDIKTRKRLLMSDDSRVDDAYIRTEQTLQIVSWIIPFGWFPIASEAFGTKKPRFIHSVALFTIIFSVIFGIYEFSGSTKMRSLKHLLLWGGNPEKNAEILPLFYAATPYGDSEAYSQKLDELMGRAPQSKGHEGEEAEEKVGEDEAAELKNAPAGGAEEGEDIESSAKPEDGEEDAGTDEDHEPAKETKSAKATSAVKEEAESDEDKPIPTELFLKAHQALTPDQQCYGQFHWYQLITHAFLHGGIIHLVGNLIFLFVFGSRVNALIGDLYTAILYPILAAISGFFHLMSVRSEAPLPLLGASGAIMGLAGMYLIFFPVNKVHMAVWIRLGLIARFKMYLKLFAVRGFWVVLFYMAFDVAYTVMRWDDGVAHWAHLGGFIAGIVFGLVLLFTRQVNARGGDIISVLLGRRAWALVGKPA